MHLPGANIEIPTLTEQDELDLVEFGIKKNCDIICASFVRKASDIEYVRGFVKQKGGKNVQIMAKIENHQGIQNFEEILAASDGIMINRRNLAMEMPPEKVYIAQKWMIEKANLSAKPIVIATEVLDSMIKSARANRVEVNDMANTVLDGADCLVLDAETADGEFVIESIQKTSSVCIEAEKALNYKRQYGITKQYSLNVSTAESIAQAMISTVFENKEISLIIAIEETGKLACLLSKYKPDLSILAITGEQNVTRQLNLNRGIVGHRVQGVAESPDPSAIAITEAKNLKLTKKGAKVAILHGMNVGTEAEDITMKILDVLN